LERVREKVEGVTKATLVNEGEGKVKKKEKGLTFMWLEKLD